MLYYLKSKSQNPKKLEYTHILQLIEEEQTPKQKPQIPKKTLDEVHSPYQNAPV